MGTEKAAVRIAVAAHKPYRMPADRMYLPLQVGAAGRESIGYRRDDEGENISELNPYFSELTGLYWAWKHLDADYVGLAHYRRHFSLRRRRGRWESVLREEQLRPCLPAVRLFLPKKRRYWIETLYSHYAHTHDERHLEAAREAISERTPAYLPYFDRAVSRRSGYMFNMMIAERTLLNDYCAWLFDILFAARRRLKPEEKTLSAYRRRFYGRISEIIFNAWLEKKLAEGALRREEIRELPVVLMEKTDLVKKGRAFLRAKFLGVRYEESF